MNVLVVITTGFNPYGGLTTVMMNYWRAMDKRGIHFDFASTNDPEQELLNEIESLECRYIKLPPRKKVWAYYKALKKMSSNYDVAHVHGNSSTSLIELAALSNVKTRIVHNHNSITEHPVINAVLHPFFLRSYTRAVACSALAGDWLFGKGNFKILKNAINVDRFKLNEVSRNIFRDEFGFSEDDVVVGNVGKIIKQKNHTFILDVFSAYHRINPKSKLLLVGTGALEDQIKAKVADLGLEDCVKMAGLRTDIPELMSTMDVFLFPSLWEGLPLSVLEAQASGLPIFLSDVISSEVHVSCECYPISLQVSPEEWARTIDGRVKKENRLELISANRTALSNAGFNIEKEADKLLNLYFEK